MEGSKRENENRDSREWERMGKISQKHFPCVLFYFLSLKQPIQQQVKY